MYRELEDGAMQWLLWVNNLFLRQQYFFSHIRSTEKSSTSRKARKQRQNLKKTKKIVHRLLYHIIEEVQQCHLANAKLGRATAALPANVAGAPVTAWTQRELFLANGGALRWECNGPAPGMSLATQ